MQNGKTDIDISSMKILWLVSITIPPAAAAFRLAASEVGGGWLTGQLTALQSAPAMPKLTICNIDRRVTQVMHAEGTDGLHFTLMPDGSPESCRAVLDAANPDLVHIWGTEYPAAAAMRQAADALGLPVLIGIQGVMRDCAAHLCDGVPAEYLHSGPVQHLINKVVPGALLDESQQCFDELAEAEAALLAHARYVTGRTDFDRAAMAALAPAAQYYPCNETLRPEFYAAPFWRPHPFGAAPTLLLSQGNYPLKNLHTVIKALPAVLAKFPQAELAVAGWPPLDKGALLRPVIAQMFPYQTYCRKLAQSLGVTEHIRYTGPLQSAAMRQSFLDCDVFLLPSTCENSPNSLGEAMLLGVPCVASDAGGISSMLESGKEGLLYGPPCDEKALGDALCHILTDRETAQRYGTAAQARARQTHDAAANAAALLCIYSHICQKSSGGEVAP